MTCCRCRRQRMCGSYQSGHLVTRQSKRITFHVRRSGPELTVTAIITLENVTRYPIIFVPATHNRTSEWRWRDPIISFLHVVRRMRFVFCILIRSARASFSATPIGTVIAHKIVSRPSAQTDANQRGFQIPSETPCAARPSLRRPAFRGRGRETVTDGRTVCLKIFPCWKVAGLKQKSFTITILFTFSYLFVYEYLRVTRVHKWSGHFFSERCEFVLSHSLLNVTSKRASLKAIFIFWK